MKMLFLDIDGVLNSRAYDCRRNWNEHTNIDETRLPLVKEIVEKTGAEIVLTSTWRRHLDGAMNACDEAGEYVVRTFAKHGLRIFSKTPDFGRGASRRDEVAAWLSVHDKTAETFVILDDCAFGWEELSPFYMRINIRLFFTLPNFSQGIITFYYSLVIANEYSTPVSDRANHLQAF